MSGFFNKEGSFDSKGLYDIHNYLLPLTAMMRNRVLGVIAGMSPIIELQIFNEYEAADVWDLKYNRQVIIDLSETRKTLPVSPLMASEIARAVYVKRHLNTIHNTIWNSETMLSVIMDHPHLSHLCNENDDCINNAINHLTKALTKLGEVEHKRYLGETEYNEERFKTLNMIIEPAYEEDTLGMTSEQWRHILRCVSNVHRSFTSGQLFVDPPVNNPEINKTSFFRIFGNEIFSRNTIGSGITDHEKDTIYNAVLNYTWDSSDKPAEIIKEPTPYNEVSAEGLNPLGAGPTPEDIESVQHNETYTSTDQQILDSEYLVNGGSL